MQPANIHRSSWRAKLKPGLVFGCDYNPEQWPEEVWAEDARLMRTAGVNLVSLGVFAWATIEPEPRTYRLDWLLRVMDLLHQHDVRVALATATASPPPWLTHRHPDVLPERADGTRLWPGSRQAFCPSSPVYRGYAAALVETLARKLGDHPAVAMWHVGNEFGCHNALCYCDRSAEAFQAWLRARYGGIEALNNAWGTRFWSQVYSTFDEVLPPRQAPTTVNPTQRLDFRRFSSDQLLANYRMERDLLRDLTPDVPITTNLVITPQMNDVDYFAWEPEVDVVANDHYLDGSDPEGYVKLAFSADLSRGVARGRPWLLMEHSTSAVNWQPRNRAKAPGELTRNSLAHVARGSDGAMFFQWRASQAGAEKYHSAMVPHAGTDSEVWRETAGLGRALDGIGAIAGSTVTAEVALLFDWESWWACELDAHPSVDVTYLDRVLAHYQAFWRRAVTVDLVSPDADLSPYRLVVVPTLYLVRDRTAAAIDSFVRAGGTALVTYFSGIVDENDHIRLGGYPGAIRDLLGVHVEEFFPLMDGERVTLDDGTTADVWTELLRLRGAEAIARYADGVLAGVPALTRHPVEAGTAWYAATRLDARGVGALVDRLITDSGITPAAAVPPGVEVVRRQRAGVDYVFVINHTAEPVEFELTGTALLGPQPRGGRVTLDGGAVVVVEEAAGHGQGV